MKTVKLVVMVVLFLLLIGGTAVFASTPMAEPQKVLEGDEFQARQNPCYGRFCISDGSMMIGYGNKLWDVNSYNPGCVWSHYQRCDKDCNCQPPGIADWCG